MPRTDLSFEDSLGDAWGESSGVAEVPFNRRTLQIVQICAWAILLVVGARVLSLGTGEKGTSYTARATGNMAREKHIAAPRGLILDRSGVVLADNRAAFSAFLDIRELLREKPDAQDQVFKTINSILGMDSGAVQDLIKARDLERSSEPLLLADDITRDALVAIRNANLPALYAEEGYIRTYPEGKALAAVTGYVGFPTKQELAEDPELLPQSITGKSGIEKQYEKMLRGFAGREETVRDAKGNTLERTVVKSPDAATPLRLTIDAPFATYFYERFAEALKNLGRTRGVGIAINPQNGEILAMMSFPSFDPNIFADSARKTERGPVLLSAEEPLFNRAVSGNYHPGSTIKPLVGVGVLAEKIVDPLFSVFSPGYLDVPNPYDAAHPSRFLDWRPQGYVNLYSAIAQSSNVYFYTVGGGFGDLKGLGIARLKAWWARFGLGKETGIDLPEEGKGFLPDPDWKEKTAGRPWRLGDTYNVSIGQGDLTVTPVQLIRYISAIANGGTLVTPHLYADAPLHPESLEAYKDEIAVLQEAMRTTVTAPRGTAYLLHDLSLPIAGKTGSAQVENNKAENAFFVGYAPADHPTLALLILVEHAKEGSLNAVPIARDVFAWYDKQRIQP